MSLEADHWTAAFAQETIQNLLQRSMIDPAFRQLCLQSPDEAVREIAGRDLPAGYRLRLVDNAGADLTIVLPDPVASVELSDADLENVAGGKAGNQCGVSERCGVSKGPNPKPKT